MENKTNESARQYVYKINDSENELIRTYEFSEPFKAKFFFTSGIENLTSLDSLTIKTSLPKSESSGNILVDYSGKVDNGYFYFKYDDYWDLGLLKDMNYLENKIRIAFSQSVPLEFMELYFINIGPSKDRFCIK
ncbi:MAG: hypothetical protein ACP5OG_04395 [Candidatus Nanoarchaeia archaeon]